MTNQIKKGILLAGIGGGALALALSGSPAFAQGGSDQAGMPSASKSSTVHASGTVTAIDKGSRTVTVKTDTGETRSFQVPSDAPTGNDIVFSIGVNVTGDTQTRFSAGSKIPIL